MHVMWGAVWIVRHICTLVLPSVFSLSPSLGDLGLIELQLLVGLRLYKTPIFHLIALSGSPYFILPHPVSFFGLLHGPPLVPCFVLVYRIVSLNAPCSTDLPGCI